MGGETSRPVVVVGVDGSQDSKEALRWAVGQARLTGGEVHAVLAWSVPVTIFFVPSYTEDDYRRDAEETLEKSLADALGDDPGGPGVPVVALAIQERPAVALMKEAADADLLVVGGHGQGELPGMHLGSVASYCIHHHCSCPVVVVCGTRR